MRIFYSLKRYILSFLCMNHAYLSLMSCASSGPCLVRSVLSILMGKYVHVVRACKQTSLIFRPVKTEDRFHMQSINLIYRRYLLKPIFFKESLNIEDFEDWRVSTNSKIRPRIWELTSSDSFIIINHSKFNDFSYLLLIRKGKLLFLKILLWFVNYTACLL